MEDAIRVDLELDPDSGDSFGGGLELEGESTKTPVVGRTFPFALQDVDIDGRLAVGGDTHGPIPQLQDDFLDLDGDRPPARRHPRLRLGVRQPAGLPGLPDPSLWTFRGQTTIGAGTRRKNSE